MKQYFYIILFFILSFNCYAQSITGEKLIFANGDKEQSDKLYRMYANDSLAKTIVKLEFVEFDTIPDKFRIFQNVSSIELNCSNTNELNMFSHLTTLRLHENSGVTINEKEEWMKKIKVLEIQKSTRIRGISSFSNMPQLEELILAFSGFEVFPSDINQLKNLKKLVLGVYIGEELNLNLLKLSELQSLKEIEIVSWSRNIFGIPTGIMNSKLQRLKIQHPNLTKEEKMILKSFSNKTVKAK